VGWWTAASTLESTANSTNKGILIFSRAKAAMIGTSSTALSKSQTSIIFCRGSRSTIGARNGPNKMPGSIEAISCIAMSVPELYVAVSHHTIAKVLIPLPNTERNCPMISKKKANSISRKEHD
jgi:hypothetical protein